MNPERVLRTFALYLATALLLIISCLWGAGALRLLSKNRSARSPDPAAPAAGRLEIRREHDPGSGQRQVLHPRGTFHEEVLRASFGRLTLGPIPKPSWIRPAAAAPCCVAPPRRYSPPYRLRRRSLPGLSSLGLGPTEDFGDRLLDEAVTLVGLLHHFRIVLVKQGGAPGRTFAVPPLRLGQAAESVSYLFGWDRRRLVKGFREHWRSLKDGPTANRIALRIAAHPDIERIEEVPDLPGSV